MDGAEVAMMVRAGFKRRAARLLPIAAILLGLGACASERVAGRSPVRPQPAYPAEPAPVTAIPSDPVTSEPLPPLAGGGYTPPGKAPAPVTSDGPVPGGNPRPSEPAPPVAVASAAPAASASPSRAGSIGNWTAKDATGSSCRVQLTSTSALDLYRANAAGCANRDLAKVTAWDFRDGEVYLYQPGGAVIARLRSDGGGLQGVLSKSGAPLSLSRS